MTEPMDLEALIKRAQTEPIRKKVDVGGLKEPFKAILINMLNKAADRMGEAVGGDREQRRRALLDLYERGFITIATDGTRYTLDVSAPEESPQISRSPFAREVS